MAIALVSKVEAQHGSSITTSSIDTTGATLLVMVLVRYQNLWPTPPTDSKSNTWTALTQKTDGTTAVRIYYAANPTVGTGHTFSYIPGGTMYGTMFVCAYSGVATTPYDAENGASGTSITSLATGSITPSENNCLVIAGIGSSTSSAETYSINGSFTIQNQQGFAGGTAFGGGIADLIQTTAAAANPTWSWSGSTGAEAVIASFKAAAAATVYTLDASGDTLNLTAGATSLLASRLLSAGGSTLTLTAGDAALLASRILAANGATLGLTAGDGALLASRVLAADGQTLALAAGDGLLLASRILSAGGATLGLTAGEAALLASRVLSADGGALGLTAGDGALLASRLLRADGATLTLTAGEAALLASRVLNADGDTLGLTAGSGQLLASRVLVADGDTLTLADGDGVLLATRRLAADDGVLAFIAGDADLVLIRALIEDPRWTLKPGSPIGDTIKPVLLHYVIKPNADPGVKG